MSKQVAQRNKKIPTKTHILKTYNFRAIIIIINSGWVRPIRSFGSNNLPAWLQPCPATAILLLRRARRQCNNARVLELC